MPDPWVTLATFDSLPMAELARGQLAQAGIRCRLLNASIMSLNPLWANAIGYIPLQVLAEDLSAAADLLRLDRADDVPGGECVACGEPLDDDGPCPMCGHVPAATAMESPASEPPAPATSVEIDDDDWTREHSRFGLMPFLRAWRRPILLLLFLVALLALVGVAANLIDGIWDAPVGSR
jgi:hypothetical protein